MTLSGLCADKTQITFAEVAQTLNIDESEVEMWVVDVVTQGLIDVKINQPKALITLRYILLLPTKALWSLDRCLIFSPHHVLMFV